MLKRPKDFRKDQSVRGTFEGIVDCVGIPIFVKDGQHRFVFVNDAACGMLGIPRDQWSGKTDYDLFPKDQADIFRTRDLHVRETADKDINEEQISDAQGNVRTIVTTKTLYADEAGEKYIIGTIQDITDRKRAEEALRENEEKYRTLVEQADDGIIIVQTAILKYVNQRMADLLGSSVELLTGSPIAEHIDDRHVARITALHRGRLAGEKLPSRYEALLRHHDGSPVETELNVGVIRYHGELATQVTVRDITERKRAEEALRWSEELYRTLIAASPDPITVTDLSGRITLGSRKALELFKVPEGTGIGHGILEWVAAEDQSRAAEAMQKLLITGESLVGEFVLKKNDGTYFDAEVHAALIGSSGDTAQGAIFITRDITERKRMEEEIIESRESLRSLADHLSAIREDEKAKIARELHDELGQSLTAVLIGLSVLRKKLRKDQRALAEGVDALIATIKSTIETIKRIQGELRPWMLDALGLCATMDWQAKYFTERTHIPVIFDWNHETVVDQQLSVALFRIFQEALSNAARHAGATEIRVELTQDDQEVRLAVIDNGRGIEGHEIRKPFSFGLLGMKERVAAFNGSLDIHGSRGKGTRLTVRLPRTEL